MIAGNIILEDHSLNFNVNYNDNTCTFTIIDNGAGRQETFTVPQEKFFKALAIAVHNDGMPDYKLDYPDAESIMGRIRWIP